ncbi:hypothetical protein IAT40_007355 [Kwoniella sp. CBS 6097]
MSEPSRPPPLLAAELESERRAIYEGAPSALRETRDSLSQLAKHNQIIDRAERSRNLPSAATLLAEDVIDERIASLNEKLLRTHLAEQVYDDLLRSRVSKGVFVAPESSPRVRLSIHIPVGLNASVWSEAALGEPTSTDGHLATYLGRRRQRAIQRNASKGYDYPTTSKYSVPEAVSRAITTGHPDTVVDNNDPKGRRKRFVKAITEIPDRSEAFKVLRVLTYTANRNRTRDMWTASRREREVIGDPVEVTSVVTANDLASSVPFWSSQASSAAAAQKHRERYHFDIFPADKNNFAQFIRSKEPALTNARAAEMVSEGQLSRDTNLTKLYHAVTAGLPEDQVETKWNELDLSYALSHPGIDSTRKENNGIPNPDVVTISTYENPDIPNLLSLMPDDTTVADARRTLSATSEDTPAAMTAAGAASDIGSSAASSSGVLSGTESDETTKEPQCCEDYWGSMKCCLGFGPGEYERL